MKSGRITRTPAFRSLPVALIFLLLLIAPAGSGLSLIAQPLPVVSPQEAGMEIAILEKVDQLVLDAIGSGETPGAVLLVLRDGKIVWRKAYGSIRTDPADPMTVETIFDLASLTKPVATATAAMQLIEAGKIRLSDPVSSWLPGFRNYGEGDQGTIRLVHLMTHTSGLPAYPPVDELVRQAGDGSRTETVFRWLDSVERLSAPGEAFRYSCPNFVTLQRVVETVSGMTLAEYTRRNIFEPLGMNSTTYNPPPEWKERTAPTDLLQSGEPLLCTVHDPFARELMGGNSGNAGLFSTADDLAIFASMMLNEGEWNGRRILSPAGVKALTTIPEGLESHGRGLGWDLNSAYASNQGDLFGPNTYGHTGFTGTSLIMDPDTRTAVILLTHRTWPQGGGGSVVRLRSLVANTVAASIVE